MKITAPYRGRRASKRLDLTDMRAVLRDTRLWTAIGRVVVPPGATSHVEIDSSDVTVDVVLQPLLQDVTCRLAAGLWLVPSVGEEVVVVLPEGEMAFMPTIVAILSTGSVPTTQGPAEHRLAIVRQEVLVHDGAGGAVALAKLAELQASVDKINAIIEKYVAHTHSGGTISGNTGIPVDVAIFPATDPVGTTVLKGK